MAEVTPHVVGPDIGTAYYRVLQSRLKNSFPHRYRVIHISDPVVSAESATIENWRETVNAGDALDAFENYEFYDGTTARYWVNNRIDVLFKGLYAGKLTDPVDQLGMIVDRLKDGRHGQTTNALVAQVFQPETDLELATHGGPLAADMACLTQLQVRPNRDKLNMHTTFRVSTWTRNATGIS